MTYCVTELVFVKEHGVQWPAQVMRRHRATKHEGGRYYTVELYHPDNNTKAKRTKEVEKLYSRRVRACELTRWNQEDADAYVSIARDYLVAMRDAENAKDVIKKVRKGANVDIRVISGDEEADLIFRNFGNAVVNPDADYLYIDVGGGSTELTLIREGKRVKSKSFQLGTVRSLAGRVPDGEWAAVNAYVEGLQVDGRPLVAIGTGGNANRLQRLALTPRDSPIPLETLTKVSTALASLTVEERRAKYHLKPDRADVIVPAAEMYLRIMAIAGSKQMLVPKVGLVDGMVLDIHEAWKREKQGKKKGG